MEMSNKNEIDYSSVNMFLSYISSNRWNGEMASNERSAMAYVPKVCQGSFT
jgi:hypothetical protein